MKIPLLILLLLLVTNAFSQERFYSTSRIEGNAPEIDGSLSDACWQNANWQGNFTQNDPYEGKPPSQNTEFAILYDDNNLFIAIKAYDSVPSAINRRLTRRDDEEADFVGIAFDSYEDKLTAFGFFVTAAGSKMDIIFTNDNNTDESWDPIWNVKTQINAEGWYAEMQIPLSQLRFTKKDSYEWGLEVARFIFRKNETSFWKPLLKNSSRVVSDFGTMTGIQNITPKKDIELFPFALGKVTLSEKEEGNPFAKGRNLTGSAGLDGKVSITNDLTLNFTVNPDFGQVEADPSEVNLSAFESFFSEKRPFFIEGRNIFSFPLTSGDGESSQTGMFYTRRLGRRPHFEPDLADNEYARMPEKTNILGAFKLSGKTHKGTSIGLLESFTPKENAIIDSSGNRSKYPVEPFTNYMVARVEQDFDKGNTSLGGIFTSTNRDLNSDVFNTLPTSAYTGGVNFHHGWNNRNYFFNVKGIFSSINGSKEAITELQTSPGHNYQRPDANYLGVDSSRTRLGGYGGTLEVGKFGGGHIRLLSWLTLRSPGLDFNDLGFLQSSDEIQYVYWMGYQENTPKGIFNRYQVQGEVFSGWNFGGERIYTGTDGGFNCQFKNFYNFYANIGYQWPQLSASDLRGGPALRSPGHYQAHAGFATDSRKKLSAEFSLNGNFGTENNMSYQGVDFSLNYKPTNAVSLSLSPSYSVSYDNTQYIDKIELPNRTDYLMGHIDTRSLALSARINVGLSPDFTIQYYAQPFLFSGKYSQFKRITDSRSTTYKNTFHDFSSSEIFYSEGDNTYTVTSGSGSYSFDNPDFHFLQFRSNLVLRWEYKAGSAFYVVWSQGRTTDGPDGHFLVNDYTSELAKKHPQNDFLIKLSYAIIF